MKDDSQTPEKERQREKKKINQAIENIGNLKRMKNRYR